MGAGIVHRMDWRYALLAGIVGGGVSMILLAIVYAAGSPILFNSSLQSKKIIDVYNSIHPLPLLVTNLPLFAAGYLLLAAVRGLVFAWFYDGIPGVGLRKGLSWGLAIWLTMILWAQFYATINLLGEPLYLAAFESALLLGVFLGEGTAVAAIYGRVFLQRLANPNSPAEPS